MYEGLGISPRSDSAVDYHSTSRCAVSSMSVIEKCGSLVRGLYRSAEENQEIRECCCLSRSNLAMFTFQDAHEKTISLTKIYGNQRGKSLEASNASELITAQI